MKKFLLWFTGIGAGLGAILLLVLVVGFQIAKASEYVAMIRGFEETRKQSNRINGLLMLVFLVLGLIGVYYCNEKLKALSIVLALSFHLFFTYIPRQIKFYPVPSDKETQKVRQ